MKFALALLFCALIGVSLQAAQNGVKNKKDELCDICKTVSEFVKNLIDEELPEEKIEEAVKALCESLPTDLANICSNVVLPLIKQIYEDVESKSAEDVCKVLSLC